MIKLTIPAISCGHCVQVVTRTVQQVDPQARVQVDVGTHQVAIDTALQPQAFTQALTDEGYAPAS